MARGVLFGTLVFLVFGVPLIDDLYRLRVRSKANQTPEMANGSTNLVPSQNEEALLNTRDGTPKVRKPEEAA